MARVRPFAAYRYARPERDISALVAPPYDVISPRQREEYLDADPHNVVALELPSGSLDPSIPGNRYETGAQVWETWRRDGTLALDPQRSIYVLEQRFDHDGHPVRRRAFIAAVGLEPFDAGVVLPHERTLPKALGDRFEMTCATGANLSQVLGLFDDPAGETDHLFDQAMAGAPASTARDADGVESLLWVVSDTDYLATLERLLSNKQLFIADGHHRYTTALAYRDLRRKEAASQGVAQVDPPYDFVMMALVNMEDPELVVMPTHRVADASQPFDAGSFYEMLSESFIVEELTHDSREKLDANPRPSFLVKTRDDVRPRLLRVRDDIDLDSALQVDRSSAWKHLDVSVLQELILGPILDIHPDRPETLDRLRFYKDEQDALDATIAHDAAFILRPTSMEQLRIVATSGETMPQKSTYFFPKLLSGLVFRSAK